MPTRASVAPRWRSQIFSARAFCFLFKLVKGLRFEEIFPQTLGVDFKKLEEIRFRRLGEM